MSQRNSVTSANESSSHSIGSSSQLKSSPTPSHTSTVMSMSSASPTSSSSKNDMSSSDAAEFEQPKPITCRWDDCGKIFYDPEDVYKHLCDDHVGRKSTNNLCLTCKWEGCDVSCAKRDHITSHVRVHTPLKPHNCDVCGKTFKRPQDLKKHERIHTEQHQQQRQQKAAQSAAARTYSKNDHLAYNGYPYPSVHDTSLLAGHEGYYNNIPYGVPQTSGLYPSPSPANGPSYTRDHYAHSVSSSASLSPMSSRLETPQGSSPPGRQENGSYMHFTSSLDGQGKMTTDNNSYTYLAQGAHASQHMAGNKRSHEQVEDFFGDLRCKKMAPAYNANMAERLDSVFGTEGLNDLSLQSIFTGYGQAPQHAQPSTTFSSQLAARQEPADLAQLNSFLLQLGASAARDLGSFSSSSSGSDYQTLPEFDIASLTQEGLHTISGFNESIWSHPMPSTHASQRPIAHLPTRVTKADDGAGYYPYVQSSFDSISMPRGNGVVPQLAPMDAGGHSFRRVDALTRAAPEETLPETDGDDEMNTVKTNGAPRYTDRYRSVSPAGSSESETAESVRRGSTPTSHSLYPRVSPQATARWVQGARDTDTTRPVSHVRKDSDLTDASSSSSLYPSLVDRVSKLDGLGGPVRSSSESAPAVSDATRREHIRLIRDLLIAINFPARAQAERASREGIRLAPILTKIEKKGAVEKDETTPVSRLRNAEFLSEVESDRASTPTPPGRPTLPTLSQLLNDIPEANRSSRPMTDRDMECDV